MMLDPKIRAEMDQALEMLAENVPPMLWRLFEGFKSQGFREDQALYLVATYLRASLSIRGGE